MALYAIGDIHGYAIAIKSLVEALNFNADDTVIFLGDYVDKGPDVSATIDYLSRLGEESPWIFLRGNHDQTFLNARRSDGDYELWEAIAGEDPLTSYQIGATRGAFATVPSAHFDFLEKRCVDFCETDDFIFVHAGLRFDQRPRKESLDYLHWANLEPVLPHESGKTVVCGHTSQSSGEILDLGHLICIDTGITKGNHITCLNLDDWSFTQSNRDGRISTGVLQRTRQGSQTIA